MIIVFTGYLSGSFFWSYNILFWKKENQMIRTAFVSMTSLMYLTELAQTAQLNTQAELKQTKESLSIPALA